MSASIGSDLFLPANAERSRAECRLPTNANEHPARSSAIDSGNHVIDVGSATAITGAYGASRFDNVSIPASVGAATKLATTSPGPTGPGVSRSRDGWRPRPRRARP